MLSDGLDQHRAGSRSRRLDPVIEAAPELRRGSSGQCLGAGVVALLAQCSNQGSDGTGQIPGLTTDTTPLRGVADGHLGSERDRNERSSSGRSWALSSRQCEEIGKASEEQCKGSIFLLSSSEYDE